MVDFTSPINNADMVKGLNKLIRLNADILASLEDLPDELEDSILREGTRELSAMHKRHIKSIGDTVRTLGGSADGTDWRHWITESKIAVGKLSGDAGMLRAIYSEEKKLQAEYERKLDELSPSPESVEVIKCAREERSEPMDWLRSVTEGGSA